MEERRFEAMERAGVGRGWRGDVFERKHQKEKKINKQGNGGLLGRARPSRGCEDLRSRDAGGPRTPAARCYRFSDLLDGPAEDFHTAL